MWLTFINKFYMNPLKNSDGAQKVTTATIRYMITFVTSFRMALHESISLNNFKKGSPETEKDRSSVT